MKKTNVKSHKRKGKMVKSHSRTVKGAVKNSGSGMSKEECKEKYDAIVLKFGADSPQAKKLAMKLEGMETIEKDARKKYTGTPDQQRIKAMKATGIKRKPIRPTNGFTAEELKKAVLKKHSRTIKKGDKFVSEDDGKPLYKIPKGKKSREAFRDEMVGATAVNRAFPNHFKLKDKKGINAPKHLAGLFKTNVRSVTDGESLKLAKNGTLKSKKASLESAIARNKKKVSKKKSKK